jgi:glycosyltransferase involved in cell wall biosynthesis
MPTKDRPEFVRIALRCFAAQTYRASELIVVDDGEASVADLCRDVERVRYIRTDGPALLGTKMNIGIAAARGRIIQKIDDDDYYSPGFLELAVTHLQQHPLDHIVAWDCFLIFCAGDNCLRYSGHGWRAGGTLCFSRRLWERYPFRDVHRAEDYLFILDHRSRLIRVCAPKEYVVVRHGRNTWRQMPALTPVDDFLRTLPPYTADLCTIVDTAAEALYRSLKAGVPAGHPPAEHL